MKQAIFTNTAPRRQTGFTIIEILVALAISLVLLTGVMKIYMSNKATYQVQEGMSRLQENARFALNFLSNDIRMAGYSGCSSLSSPPNNIVDLDNDGNADTVSDFTTGGLFGFEYSGLPIALTASDNLSTTDVVAATDVIVILKGSTQDIQLTGNLVADNANIQLAGTAAGLFQAGDIMFISDCTSSDIFAANNVSNGGTITIAHSNSVNITNRLSKAYGSDAVVMALEKTAYYIGTNASGISTLYRKRMIGSGIATEELVEGIETMQIQYGEDLTGDGIANKYANAGSIADMANVVSVRISLLLRTITEINPDLDTSTYTVLDASVNPVDDRRSRRIFTKTIKLRNKGII